MKDVPIGNPIPAPPLKPWMVLCCGCYRLMDRDGKPWAPRPLDADPKSGVVPIGHIADFATHAEADQFAKGHGWQIADEAGPNHRCPDCLKESEAKRGRGRGAYVTREWLNEIGWFERKEQNQ